jgi:hypothetical protein
MLPKLTPIGLTYLDLRSCLLLLLRGERLGASEDRGRKKRKQCEGGKIWRRKRDRKKNKKTHQKNTQEEERGSKESRLLTPTTPTTAPSFFSLWEIQGKQKRKKTRQKGALFLFSSFTWPWRPTAASSRAAAW